MQWRKAGKLNPGIHFRVKGTDPDPETGELTPDWHWFGSRLDVLGYTRDGDSREWGRYLAIYDGDGKAHHIAMPMTAMAGDGTEYRRELLRHGFVLAPGRTAREQLDVYMSMWRPKRRLRCVGRIGWHGSRFVLPDRTFGPGGETVILQATRPAKFAVAGSLGDWKRQVAAPAVGNSRLVFALAASFAGPLLHLAGQESGGFHFRGGSSIGKTSALHAARSTWGCALGSWRTTDNAAETTAAGACDTLYLLDEVSQADARAVDAMAYMLGNGSGKSRATRDGGAREVATWRILFLSTGELSLADKIAETGKRARAGQSVRVIDIPADAGQGLGIFDTLHDFASGAALADHLRRSGEAHSGHAARAFLEQIADDPAATAEAVREWATNWLTATLPAKADGQVARVAARFALVAAAGELATALDILPWPAGEASAAATRCFNDWLAARGDNGPEEITAGLRQVRAFLESHGTSRFEEAWPADTRKRADITPEAEIAIRKTINRAGFRRLENEGQGENWEYYVLPEAWRSEICAGFDATIIAKAMIAKGWMAAGGGSTSRARFACQASQDPAPLRQQQLLCGRRRMSARKLHRALARLRELSPPVATTEASCGDSSAGGEIQAVQGFGETVATVATVSTEFVARSKISTCGHERSAFAGCTSKTVATGGDSGDSQEPRGIPLSPPLEAPVATVATTPPAYGSSRHRFVGRGLQGGEGWTRTLGRAWARRSAPTTLAEPGPRPSADGGCRRAANRTPC